MAIAFATALFLNCSMKRCPEKFWGEVSVLSLPLRAGETLWSAGEIASAVLSAERERHRECVSHRLKMMSNTMECKRDSFSGALGGVRETYWKCVSHHLEASFFTENCKFLSNTSIYTLNWLPLWKRELITRNTVEGNAGLTEKVNGSKQERISGLTGNRTLPGEVLPGELSVLTPVSSTPLVYSWCIQRYTFLSN